MGNTDDRGKLLLTYMDRLGEKYPEASSEQIRDKAEKLVAQKLGEIPLVVPSVKPLHAVPESPPVIQTEDSVEGSSDDSPSFLYDKKTVKKDYALRFTTQVTEWIFILLSVVMFINWFLAAAHYQTMQDQGALKSAMQVSQLLDELRNIILWFGIFLIVAFICHGIRVIVAAIDRLAENQA